MKTPIQALVWEIWQRHRNRLLAIVGVLVLFAVFYPPLCARMGLNLAGPNALDNSVSSFGTGVNSETAFLRVLHILGLLFVLLGPAGCMVVSLLYLIWIFTGIPMSAMKEGTFPTRYFTLPLSTRFLAGWFMGAGTLLVVVIHLGWTHLVGPPKIDELNGFLNLLAWVTSLAVVQAILWSLDSFPITRLVLLIGAVFGLGFLTGPGPLTYPFFQRNQTLILGTILLIGCGTAYAGLRAIRQGGWRIPVWFRGSRFPVGKRQAAAARPVPQFVSLEQAQSWFEWRRSGRAHFFYVCALGGVPLVVHLVIYAFVYPQRMNGESTLILCLYLLAVPLFIHFCQGAAPERGILPFVAVRPITNGEVVMAKFRTTAKSSILSWVVTLVLLAFVPVFGDMSGMLNEAPLLAQYQSKLWLLLPVILLALVFLTWRSVAADLCFGLAGNARIARLPVIKIWAFILAGGLLFGLSHYPNVAQKMLSVLPFVLGFLVVCKLTLARWAFRVSIERRLLARRAMIAYLAIWAVIGLILLVPTALVFRQADRIVSLLLGIVLLLPLARIGFAPIALQRGRHG